MGREPRREEVDSGGEEVEERTKETSSAAWSAVKRLR
jgi:hypothetical protein